MKDILLKIAFVLFTTIFLTSLFLYMLHLWSTTPATI
jgi:hypothetical protein